MRRNILYESECERCGDGDNVTVGSLKRQEQEAFLYVGESARSLCERSTEHWQAAELMKEESHMVQHSEEAHNGENNHTFKFRVVRSFRSALDRQIGEAIRIEMRGSVLNRRGEFNRCSLTRLGLDREWEDDRWKKSWERVENQADDSSVCLVESQDLKRPGDDNKMGSKRLKLEADDKVWGEQVDHCQVQRGHFLMSGSTDKAKPNQSTLPFLTGMEWIAYSVVKEMAWEAVDSAFCMKEVANWEEWDLIEPHGAEVYETIIDASMQVRECGTAQSALPSGFGGDGGEGAKPKTKCGRSKRKNKLPGVSAHQRSVADLFSKNITKNTTNIAGIRKKVRVEKGSSKGKFKYF